MKGYISSQDIEKAVDVAEVRGLVDFMSRYPQAKKGATSKKKGLQIGGHTGTEHDNKQNFFDVLMFGNSFAHPVSTSAITEEQEIHLTESIEVLTQETCNPCEEVREMVEGIRQGKYKLAYTGFQEEMDEIQTSKLSSHNSQLKRPSHWTTTKRNQNSVHQTQTFKRHKTYWDGGNMKALRMTKKK